MHFATISAAVATLASTVLAQGTFYDAKLGITFAEKTQDDGVIQRIALPINSTTSDAILQVVVPNTYNWCGFAWGGAMANNPLSVAWPTKLTTTNKVLVSSRMASGYDGTPPAYKNATYTVLANSVDTTSWSITTRCQGCTAWTVGDYSTNIQNDEFAVFAYACAIKAPTIPSVNISAFAEHDVFNIWGQDLTSARNASYSSWVTKKTATLFAA